MSLFAMGTGGTGVATFDFESMQRTVSSGVPVGDDWRPMGGMIVGTASGSCGGCRKAKTGNGGVGVGQSFCELLICSHELLHGVVLLESGVCQVVKQSGHHGGLFRLGSNLVGKGTVVCHHPMDVHCLGEGSHPMELPAVPCLVKERTTFPLMPRKFHAAAVEGGLRSSSNHRGF